MTVPDALLDLWAFGGRVTVTSTGISVFAPRRPDANLAIQTLRIQLARAITLLRRIDECSRRVRRLGPVELFDLVYSEDAEEPVRLAARRELLERAVALAGDPSLTPEAARHGGMGT